jgi:NADH dehydrogenase (ubiquinone) Fe-S protein 1
MISIKINNFDFLVKKDLSVLEACKLLGFVIPRFCFHESLSVSGNCRMCLVEISGSEKPVASCVTEIENNMSIWLDTPFVKKARENVVETLLINHPLDCPICDQAGECDLQDQSKLYGSDFSRQFYVKTGVEDKECGPLIKTIMTRCIHCTRCVRFCDEVAGLEFFGTFNRGGHTEIGPYVSRLFESEISGNVIDLCPVGALTSKVYAFKARPWEMKMSESIDITDGVGSNVYVNYKELNIQRITPKSSLDINDNFLSDKARFSFDSLKINRLDSVYQRKMMGGGVVDYTSISPVFLPSITKDMGGSLVLVNEMLGLKQLTALNRLSKRAVTNLYVAKIDIKERSNFFIQNSLDSVRDLTSHTFSTCFLLSCNLKLEASIVNLRLRIKHKKDFLSVYSLGSFYRNDYVKTFINVNVYKTILFLEGKQKLFSKNSVFSRNCIFVLGSGVDRVVNSELLVCHIRKLFTKSCIINITTSANSAGHDFFNIKTVNTKFLKKIKNVMSVKLDDTIFTRKLIATLGSTQKYTVDCFGSAFGLKTDYLVPTTHYLEEEDFFLNLEKRAQKTSKICNSYKNTKDFKSIISLLYNTDAVEKPLPAFVGVLFEGSYDPQFFNTREFFFERSVLFNMDKKKIGFYPIKNLTEDLYITNSFCRNSLIMQNCSQRNRIQSNF